MAEFGLPSGMLPNPLTRIHELFGIVGPYYRSTGVHAKLHLVDMGTGDQHTVAVPEEISMRVSPGRQFSPVWRDCYWAVTWEMYWSHATPLRNFPFAWPGDPLACLAVICARPFTESEKSLFFGYDTDLLVRESLPYVMRGQNDLLIYPAITLVWSALRAVLLHSHEVHFYEDPAKVTQTFRAGRLRAEVPMWVYRKATRFRIVRYESIDG